MDECHIQSHPSGDLLFLLQNWTTHVLLIVLSKKNRGGSTTATCPDRILGLIPVAVSCLFPEFLWSSFAWCVSEFFFSDGRLFLNLGKGWNSKYMSTYTHTYIYIYTHVL